MSLLPPFCVKSWNHGHVSLQCLYAGLTNCRLFTASCLVALVFLWDLLLSTMPPSHVKLRETCWEILTQGTACQDASPCQEEQVSYDPGFPKQTHDERLALNEKDIKTKQNFASSTTRPSLIHQLAAHATKMFLVPNHSNPTGESTLILETPGDKLGS